MIRSIDLDTLGFWVGAQAAHTVSRSGGLPLLLLCSLALVRERLQLKQFGDLPGRNKTRIIPELTARAFSIFVRSSHDLRRARGGLVSAQPGAGVMAR